MADEKNLPTTGEHGLTDRQNLFVEAVLQGLDDQAALAAAGYGCAQNLGSVGTSEPVTKALRRQRMGRLTGTMAKKALDRIDRLISDDRTPAATAFAASKWVLEQAGHTAGTDGGPSKPVGEMTERELEAFIRRAEQVIASGGDAPTITVTPKDGA